MRDLKYLQASKSRISLYLNTETEKQAVWYDSQFDRASRLIVPTLWLQNDLSKRLYTLQAIELLSPMSLTLRFVFSTEFAFFVSYNHDPLVLTT